MTSLYDISVPVVTNVLNTSTILLKKAEEYAKEKNISMSDLLDAKLYDDMLPLKAQIFIINGTSRKVIERLTGVAPPELEKGDKTLEDLYAITADTLKELSAATRDKVDGKENTVVPCKFGPTEYEAKAVDYIQGYSIPTVYFHLDMTYAILRMKGVPLGKKDYMTEFVKKFDVIKA